MTTRMLIVFHSGEGQTASIAERLADRLRGSGISVDVARAEDGPDPADYDIIVAGDSIHAGRHSRQLARWLSQHAAALDEMPLAVFQVSLTSAGEDGADEAHVLLHRLLDATGADPDVVGLFAGALRYTAYGWITRRLMRRIAAARDGDTDISRDHEYTDWVAVDHFADDVAAMAGASPG